MKRVFVAFERKLAPHRLKFLHLVFIASLGGVIWGWSFLDRLGPMGIILPAVLVIGAGLSEAEYMLGAALNNGAGSAGWLTPRKKGDVPRDR
jgi:hypothetical protein